MNFARAGHRQGKFTRTTKTSQSHEGEASHGRETANEARHIDSVRTTAKTTGLCRKGNGIACARERGSTPDRNARSALRNRLGPEAGEAEAARGRAEAAAAAPRGAAAAGQPLLVGAGSQVGEGFQEVGEGFPEGVEGFLVGEARTL
jgi:hypothetical protein